MPGLAGVPAARSGISDVDGRNGILEYRGIRIEELAAHSTFLETSYLLLFNRLPARPELERFTADVTQHRPIKGQLLDLIRCLPEHGHPMDALQAAVAALGMFYPGRNVQDQDNNYWSVVRLIAKLPTIVAAFTRIRRGDDHVPPRDDLTFSENFLYMLTAQAPDRVVADVLDACLILHAEHTMNASTFCGLITASTLADPYTVVASAIGALKGPLHGGANEEVMAMLREIGTSERVRPYLQRKLDAKQPIMGFGHRVYQVKDPRAVILQQLTQKLLAQCGAPPLYGVLEEVERVGLELLEWKHVHPNVDFYSGIMYDQMGIPSDTFTPIFAMARVTGWLAHWLEQLKANKLYRPSQIYEGEHGRRYLPLDQRGPVPVPPPSSV